MHDPEKRNVPKLHKDRKETGNALFKANKYREAQALYSEALEVDPLNSGMNSKLYYNRALVNSKIGDLRGAIAIVIGTIQSFGNEYT